MESTKRQTSSARVNNLLNYESLDSRWGIIKCRFSDMSKQERTKNATDNKEQADKEAFSGSANSQFCRRGLGLKERDWVNRSRAAELSARYELDCDKDTTLNRHAEMSQMSQSINTRSLSLGSQLLKRKQVRKIDIHKSEMSLSNAANPPTTLFNPSGGWNPDSFSNENDVSATPRKQSFDQIFDKLGFPRSNYCFAQFTDEKRELPDAEEHDHDEKQVPKLIHDDMTHKHCSQATKMPKTKAPNPDERQRPVLTRHIIIPELC